MNNIIEKFQNKITGERLFFAALVARLVIASWDSTMFPSIWIARKMALLIVIGCCVAKIVFFDNYTFSEIIVMVIVGGCMVLNTLKTGTNIFFVLFLLVVASKGVDFRKLLRIYLIVVGSIVLFAFICSIFGVIKNLRYWSTKENYFRNSFGIVYCTDFAAHVFFWILTCFYLRGRDLRWFEYIGTIFLALFVYSSSHGKLDSACLVITVIVFLTGNMITKNEIGINKTLKNSWIVLWQFISIVFMIIASSFMIIITALYKSNIRWMRNLDIILSTRLSTTHNTLTENGFKLFGQKIELIGNGLTTIEPEDYNFPDCSFLYILITSGLVILIIVLLSYTYGVYKNNSDIYLMYAIVIVAINCMISHHLFDISYNPFTFIIMANVINKNVIDNVKEKQKIHCFTNF